jgi:hypothetical protein
VTAENSVSRLKQELKLVMVSRLEQLVLHVNHCHGCINGTADGDCYGCIYFTVYLLFLWKKR